MQVGSHTGPLTIIGGITLLFVSNYPKIRRRSNIWLAERVNHKDTKAQILGGGSV